jgi:hypothetical protein
MFVGPDLAEAAPGDLELWKGDPHGMSWIDFEGTAHPELFVARGGLGAELGPPHAPKRDAYYRHREGTPPYQLSRDAVPPDYDRARRAEAVDVDNDGQLEVWIGSRDSANRLLARESPGVPFRDRAPALGLDAQGAETGSFCDFDGDGWQDLFVVSGGMVELLRNIGGERFEPVAGADIGIALPESGRARNRFDSTQLRFVDLDRDGDLDLFLLGYGARRVNLVFRREGDRFRDATMELGLGDALAGAASVVVDLDDDGFPELINLGKSSVIWHNRGGRSFAPVPLPVDAAPRGLVAATVLDADGDGPRDVFAVGIVRHLLWNRSERRNDALEVVLRRSPTPIGALVTGVYTDGSRLAQRYGSEHSTVFSQAVLPLRFGVPAGVELDAILVRWPGTTQESRHPVEGRDTLVIEP